MSTDFKTLAKDGLWNRNGVFSMMLGLCPSMAMTTSATNGFGMGMATLVVIVATSFLVSTFRKFITQEVRIAIFVVISAVMVTVVDMAMNAWLHELYKVLGLFIPLIVVNCLPMARMESFSSKQPLLPSVIDGLFTGLGFTLALTLMGAVREIIGSGTLFADASLLLGPAFKVIEMRLLPEDMGVLIMILPPGAFLVLGLLIVAKRLVDQRLERRAQQAAAVPSLA